MDALRSLLSTAPPKPAKNAGGRKRRDKTTKPARRASHGPRREMTAAELLREAELRG